MVVRGGAICVPRAGPGVTSFSTNMAVLPDARSAPTHARHDALLLICLSRHLAMLIFLRPSLLAVPLFLEFVDQITKNTKFR